MRLSYSSISLYNNCKLNFLFDYILKATKENKIPTCYGIAGGLVHWFIEDYVNSNNSKEEYLKENKELFSDIWFGKKLNPEHKKTININNLLDFRGIALDCNVYWDCVVTALNHIDTNDNALAEEVYILEDDLIHFKGIIDYLLEDCVCDWKTSTYSKKNELSYIKQIKTYIWIVQKCTGEKITKGKIYFLKTDKVIDVMVTEEDIEKIDREMYNKWKDINDNLTNWLHFVEIPCNKHDKYNNPCGFCDHKDKCKEVEKMDREKVLELLKKYENKQDESVKQAEPTNEIKKDVVNTDTTKQEVPKQEVEDFVVLDEYGFKAMFGQAVNLFMKDYQEQNGKLDKGFIEKIENYIYKMTKVRDSLMKNSKKLRIEVKKW